MGARSALFHHPSDDAKLILKRQITGSMEDNAQGYLADQPGILLPHHDRRIALTVSPVKPDSQDVLAPGKQLFS